MAIKFVTGNKNKFQEIQSILGLPLEQVNIDLPEPPTIYTEEIIRQKLTAAEAHATGEYIVEDTSLYFDCFKNKLPGPFIKWFEKVIGNDGIVELVQKYKNTKAEAVVVIGYIHPINGINFFEGKVRGDIVPYRGDKDFGWGPIFQPEGYTKTFGEMERDEKHEISMRAIATKKLKKFLESDAIL